MPCIVAGLLRQRVQQLERQIDEAAGSGDYGRANQLMEEQRQVEDQLAASGADVDPAKAAWLAKQEQGVRVRAAPEAGAASWYDAGLRLAEGGSTWYARIDSRKGKAR